LWFQKLLRTPPSAKTTVVREKLSLLGIRISYYGGVLLVNVKNIRPEAFQAKISVENIDRITNVVGQNLSNQR
jgi:hypothetical protein